MIETKDLTKRYGDLVAVDHLNLRVKKGEIFGFLGHNGSGKTTTIMMLTGLIQPTKGSAKVAGYSIDKEILEVKKRIGFLPENTSYYDNLTAMQNLDFYGELAGLSKTARKERSEELLKLVGLEKWKDTKVGKYSKGMQQKFGFAQALIRDPEVIFLDEPTAGLDPHGTKDVRNLILKLGREEGKTIFLSSHFLGEVKQVCDRVGILKQGKLAAEGEIWELARKVADKGLIDIELEVSGDSRNIIKELCELQEIIEITKDNSSILVKAKEDIREEIYDIVSSVGIRTKTLSLREPTLEEIYMKFYEVDA